MDNTKDFKENYIYNAKIVLQIIEKSEKENQTKTEIKQKKEKVQYKMESINQAFSEVYDIINHLDIKLYNRIPTSFIEMIKENMDNTYHPQIDYSISINKQEILKDTRIILSLIYRDYICSSEKKEELRYNDMIELKNYHKENLIEFNYNDIFNKKKEYMVSNKNNEIVVHRERIFIKIINKIKSFFVKLKMDR